MKNTQSDNPTNLSLKEYKQKIKQMELDQKDNLSLLFYVCIAYLLFGTINIAGKILMAGSFDLNASAYQLIIFNSMPNMIWMIYFISAPVGLMFISWMVIRMKFRVVLFLASFGPQILLLVPLYCQLCINNQEFALCHIGAIYPISIILAFISGTCSGLFTFGMLFYLTNISKADDKALFYGAFFLLYQKNNIQWLTGALFGELAISQIRQGDSLTEYYSIIMITEFVLCFLFFGVLEPEGESKLIRLKRRMMRCLDIQDQLIGNLSNEQLKLRNLIISQDKKDDQQKQKGSNRSQSSFGTLSLQYFSMDEEDIKKIVSGSVNYDDGIQLVDLEQRTYLGKLYLTWRSLTKISFQFIVPSVMVISFIQTFILIYLFKLIYFAYKQNLESKEGQTETATYLIINANFTGFVYFGVGQLFGSFALGAIGDFKDKIRALITVLILLQFGALVGWLFILYDYYVIIYIFCAILGFCEAGITSTIISIVVYEYPYHIYMIDLVYFIFSMSFVISCPIYMVSINDNYQIALILLQIVGIIGIIAALFYLKLSKSDKNNQNYL